MVTILHGDFPGGVQSCNVVYRVRQTLLIKRAWLPCVGIMMHQIAKSYDACVEDFVIIYVL